jgi:hypothetical protein
MNLFAGLSATDYQDILRAVGALIDAHGLRDVRLWEHDDGLVLQARGQDSVEGAPYQTFLLTDDDLRDLLHDAYERRNLHTHNRLDLCGRAAADVPSEPEPTPISAQAQA